MECGRNDQLKPETEFITGATNDQGNNIFCNKKIANIALQQDNLDILVRLELNMLIFLQNLQNSPNSYKTCQSGIRANTNIHHACKPHIHTSFNTKTNKQ